MDNIVLISLSQEQLKAIIKEAVHEELSRKKEKELLNFKETCEFLGISASALNKWKSLNKIPFRRLGKRIFFNREEIINSLNDSKFSKLQIIKC
jgi:predicted DNA-binding transcriptional regulator AlpA